MATKDRALHLSEQNNMHTFGIAVKAFIVKGESVLLLRRRDVDPHNAGSWEFPGGRLEITEDLEQGLQREIMEETGLEIEVLIPFEAHTFVRDDRQSIVMITYLCKPKNELIHLSNEHQAYEWVMFDQVIERSKWLSPVMKNFETYTLRALIHNKDDNLKI